jgi:hypothetical protein
MKHSKYLRTKPYRLHKRHIPRFSPKVLKYVLKWKICYIAGGGFQKLLLPKFGLSIVFQKARLLNTPLNWRKMHKTEYVHLNWKVTRAEAYSCFAAICIYSLAYISFRICSTKYREIFYSQIQNNDNPEHG